MRQFKAFKAQQPGCVLFFRMGDFYELFGEDAETVAPALGLAITSRGNGIAVAGVPHHQRDRYLQKAVDAGFRIAVVDQIQDPKDAKGVVDRAITQVVSPGTLVDESLLDDDAICAVASVAFDAGGAHAAIADLSTGAFSLWSGRADTVGDELLRSGVREILYADDDGDGDAPPAVAQLNLATTARPAWHFRDTDALEELKRHYAVATLGGFGVADDDPAIGCAAAIVRYLRETQAIDKQQSGATSGSEFQRLRATLAHLRPPRREDASNVCVLDTVSLRALEVDTTLRVEPGGNGLRGSLRGIFLDAATGPRRLMRTPMGKRLIRGWLCRPLRSADAILARQRVVATLVEDRRLAGEIGDVLEGTVDIERIAARVALGRPTPRDVVGLGRTLTKLAELTAVTAGTGGLAAQHDRLESLGDDLAPLADRIDSTCVEAPPPHLRSGGLFRDGIDAELDEARGLQTNAGEWLSRYQAELIERHDLPSLKVGFNKVFGYYIELPAAQAKRAPDVFSRKQTLKNAERYITPELKEFEDKITTAESRAVAREHELYRELIEAIAERVVSLGSLADAIAELDALLGLADKAFARAWVRPEITDDAALDIKQGRHPVVDEHGTERFIPNDTRLGAHGSPRLALITGPNMAGKSTYIRQTALLTLLASIGSYIPAEAATIGTCDRIFTRVGADDALYRGQSTFMVEMTETAAILNGASDRSLVVLDEIGRGTSTLDGLSLAWAIAEALAGNGDRGPRTLFATHYHELTDLAERSPEAVHNLHVAVKEWNGEIVFLHQIRPGSAAGSYGVHVARLAGVPSGVADRAEQIMATLSVQTAERMNTAAVPKRKKKSEPQLGLFTEFIPHPAVDRLKELKLDTLSPMQAFDALRELAELADAGLEATPDR